MVFALPTSVLLFPTLLVQEQTTPYETPTNSKQYRQELFSTLTPFFHLLSTNGLFSVTRLKQSNSFYYILNTPRKNLLLSKYMCTLVSSTLKLYVYISGEELYKIIIFRSNPLLEMFVNLC